MARTMFSSTRRFLRNEDGVTAVECALMLALVVVVCLVVLSPLSAESTNVEDPPVATDAE